jgi:arsenic resistance protein ArsH
MIPHRAQAGGPADGLKHQPQYNISESTPAQGDLNNTSSMRQVEELRVNEDFAYRSLAIPTEEDDPETASKYRPFLLDSAVAAEDWVSKLELATVTEMAYDDIVKTGERLKVLVLYGSLRQRYEQLRRKLIRSEMCWLSS